MLIYLLGCQFGGFICHVQSTKTFFAIESMNLLFVFSRQKNSLPVPIAALVTRITRWPLPLKLKTVSTKDDKLDNNGKCVFSLQMDEVPIFNTIVREDLLLR